MVPGPRSFDPRPREGATSAALQRASRSQCFDPRPREGATVGKGRPLSAIGVSIHAPAKGRPHMCRLPIACDHVSIHAPREGATFFFRPDRPVCMVFRSTPPRRGDRPCVRSWVMTMMFRSTPPRRGDQARLRPCRQEAVSIHAPAKGRPLVSPARDTLTLFRSTPPRRGDILERFDDRLKPSFDPRPREGATR